MPKFLMKRWHGYHVIALFSVAFIFTSILTYYQTQIGVFGLFLLGVVIIFTVQAKASFERDLEAYITTLSYRVNKAGEEAVTKMPMGILLFNEEYEIQWANPFMSALFPVQLIGMSLAEIMEDLIPFIKAGHKEEILLIKDSYYHVTVRPEERLLYFVDVTEKEETRQLYEEEQLALAFIYLDNYDEVTQGMEDQVRSKLMSQVTSSLNKWANENDVLLRRTASDRFIGVFNQRALSFIEETRFDILDEIKDETGKEKVPITLSVGVGAGESSLRELGKLAQSSLDLALGRGGDQVAIKSKNGKVRFYGGKSNAMEKRTRVRSRVISHALRDFVLESDRVIVMGHTNPDMDAIGAAIGVLKIAEVNGKEACVVLDREEINPDVQKLLEEIEKHDYLWSKFKSPDQVLEELTDQTLLVVVDTHKPSLVLEPRLLDRIDRIVVLDHHRRGEEFIEDPVLVYMEPYASSTAELVTELLEYQPKKLRMDVLEATALMAGIIVDTKSFAIRTGARTFDAASFLRSHGADTILVQKLLKEDMEQYIKRSKLIENSYIYDGGIALAKAKEGDVYNQVLIAQAADTLLTMKDVVASFVISKRKDGRVSISARSLGDVNVQLIMEQLNGGGHLTNAATQLTDVTIDEAEVLLIEAIDKYQEGET